MYLHEVKNDWWFFVNGFVNELWDKFPQLENSFSFDLLENTINLLVEKAEYPHQLIEDICKIIPVEYDDVEYWVNR